ncbi:MAG: hypothetical protein FJZ67_03180 [Bacteroidetes bacterium]|nr:hypothetical protein [Bacteroidota bacterium]
MIRLILTICFFTSLSIFAQSFGNEWINYNQKYYSFPIVQSGIYKLNYSTLLSAGIPLSTFQSANIQIFGREKEIPLHIEDGGDNTINTGDYILFYAQRNDGWLDSTLYDDPSWLGNPKYSLYNDTIQYFFTWNNLTTNKRIQIQTDINVSSYTPENFVLFEKSTWYNERYNEGEKTSDASSSFFVQGEGWGKTALNGVNPTPQVWDFSSTQLENIFQGTGAPNLNYSAVVVGSSNAYSGNGLGNHHTRHTIGASNFVLFDSIFSGYKSVYINKIFPVSIVPASGNSNYKVSLINDLGVATDFQSINFWSFKYPRIPNFNNATSATFSVLNSTLSNKIRLNISNLNVTNPVAFSIGSQINKIPMIQSGGQWQCLVPNDVSLNEQTIVIQDLNSVNNISLLKPVNSTGQFTNYGGIPNLENALLFVYPEKLRNKALEYASYRSSNAGGSYNVILAQAEDLCQQFGGGIPKHINGIRRFSHLIYENATQKPIGLFLVGKGIREANITSSTNLGPGSRTNTSAYQNNLIPSFGQPSCDQCITSNLENYDKFAPLIPTGRISVQTEAELQTYLSKVIEYELQQNQQSIYSTSTKDWQKHILHFSGGTSSGEQTLFKNYLNTMAETAEGAYFAGDVMAVAKDNNNPISLVELDVIKERISDGISLMNFFGHFTTSDSGFDINIDEPQNWDNQGKYPVLLANSCYNGNIFHNANSNSQSFVLTPNAGVIAYIGTINYGFTSSLYQYSSNFYKQFSKYNYGGTIAEHIKNTMDTVLTNSSNLLTEATFCQMTLNGDPMLRLNYHQKPEIELTDSRVSFGPNLITYATDSLNISITLRNLGKSITDTFSINITRDFPNSLTDSTYILALNGLDYEKTISVKIPFQPSIGIGLNKFTIRVDIPNAIDEQYDEIQNNQLIKNFNINVDGIEPILPSDFAVVPSDSVTLFASTIDPLAQMGTYRFEIDTVVSFSSNFKRYCEKTELGGLKQVNPSEWKSAASNLLDPLVLTDSTVYYWRVALIEPTIKWKNRSFQHIINKSGWGQADFDQFKFNSFNGVNLSDQTELRGFQPNEARITCLAKTTNQAPAHYDNEWTLNGVQQDYSFCDYINPNFQVAVIDKSSLEAWATKYTYSNGTVANPQHGYYGNLNNDNSNCFSRPMKYFTFGQNSLDQINKFQYFVENVVPNGDYILVYTPIATRYDWWNQLDPTLYTTFQNLGSTQIVPGRPNKPMIFLTRKGDPNFVVEIFTQGNEDIFLDTVITGIESIGRETSPLIGPSAEWKSIFWNHKPSEQPTADTTSLEIRLFNATGNYLKSIDTVLISGDSLLNLTSVMPADSFPYIKLVAKYTDTVNLTPSQLKYWQVLYDEVPEAAIDGTNGYVWLPENDTLQEGQIGKFAIDVKNISSVNMDSLLVRYYIIDQNQIKHFLNYPRQDSLLVGGILNDTISFNTKDLVGNNWFCMEVNPYVDASLTILDQPELTHLNNIIQFPFTVLEEDINPLLDVTFNGKHILNNDIVSPTSEILISLKDENPYLIMDSDADTSLFGIYLTDPDGNQKRIPFTDASGNTVMEWIPATSQNKRFKINYPTYFEKSGTYSLLVQGMDKSGNQSGDLEYKINFEVIHESMITQMMNYPNPFSTSTRFVFTLTGDEIPDDLQIQIMTISGKVVREINESELGPIQIGRNITDFEWDGKDAFGDPLANGVYLYRVKAKINGQEIKRLESGADNYFHKGLGKMYIIR